MNAKAEAPCETITPRQNAPCWFFTAVISEVSLSNSQTQRALDSGHMTPAMLQRGLSLLPKDVRAYATHIKSYSRAAVVAELAALDRPVTVLQDGMSLAF